MDALSGGALLGRFRVVSELGRGGMGVVYRAHDVELRRDVALKVLPADFAAAPDRRARFLREARAGAALAHPNVVVVHEIGEAEGRIFVAMELVEGESLRARLARGRLPPGEALAVARGIARAMAHAHAQRLVHRDLKPDNVMLAEGGAVKVLDFGIAKELDVDPLGATAGPESLTGGGILGTPAYMSPEQATGRPVGPASDVFSFGVVLYELLTGLRPFDEDNVGALIVAITRDAPRPLDEAAPGLVPALAALVMRCLEKDPAARFASGAELVAALDAVPAEPAERAPRPEPPAPAAPPLASPLAVTEPALPAPTAPPRRRRLAVLGAVALAGVALLGAAGLAASGALPGRARAASTKPTEGDAGRAEAAPTAVVDLPAPAGTRPEVAVLWREALRAHEEGRLRDLRASNRRVLDADPTFAPARVQFAATALLDNDYDAAARDEVERARADVASLSARDRALLEAAEAVLLRTPADYAEALRRLEAGTARSPGDAQLWFYRGVIGSYVEGHAPAQAAARRAVELDPGYALGRWFLAQVLDYAGRSSEAREQLAACLRTVTASASCLVELAWLEQSEGRCEAMEAVARRYLVAAANERGQLLLANALASRGERRAVADLLAATYAGPEAKSPDAPLYRARLAALGGDFAAALAEFGRGAEPFRPDGSEVEQGRRARLEALVRDESGDAAGAERVAAEFLARKAALEPNPRNDDFGVAAEPLPWLLPLAVRGRAITPAAGDAALAAWTAGWRTRIMAGLGGFVWTGGAAVGALVLGTDDAGRKAVAAFDPAAPVPPYQPKSLGEAAAGVALLLGGRVDEALPWLERAVKKCATLDDPIEQTRAAYHLGRAREQKADAAGACDAYRIVLDRWGHARPRSVTGERAAARARALGCK
jgi:serine/threonine-protein kinase